MRLIDQTIARFSQIELQSETEVSRYLPNNVTTDSIGADNNVISIRFLQVGPRFTKPSHFSHPAHKQTKAKIISIKVIEKIQEKPHIGSPLRIREPKYLRTVVHIIYISSKL